MIMSHLL